MWALPKRGRSSRVLLKLNLKKLYLHTTRRVTKLNKTAIHTRRVGLYGPGYPESTRPSRTLSVCDILSGTKIFLVEGGPLSRVVAKIVDLFG